MSNVLHLFAASLWNSLTGACFPPSYNILFQEESQFPSSAPLSRCTCYFSSIVALYLEWLLALFGANNYALEKYL